MNHQIFDRFRLVFVSVALVFLAAACGDAAIKKTINSDDPDIPREGEDIDTPTNQYLLVPLGEVERLVNVADNVELKVQLYEKGSGDVAADQAISYEIIESTAEQAGSLASRNTTTNESGIGNVVFRSGIEPATVKIRASHASANSVDFVLEIQPESAGGLKVQLTNTAPTIMRLQDIDVRLYRNDAFTCDDFYPLISIQQEPLALRQAEYAGDSVTFSNLSTRPGYVVTAIARGDRDQVVAGGCSDRIRIEGDRTIDIEMLLQFIPLMPVGQYDVISHWDFTDALADSGTVGAVIVRVLNVFDNPGQAIYTEIINLIRNIAGGIISTAIDLFMSATNLDQVVQNTINNFIEGNENLRKLRDAGRDLRSVVANLQVHSQLTIGKLSSNYEFRGTDNWIGVTLYWRWNCTPSSPPDCGAIRLVPNESGQFEELGLLSSEWTGRVVAYNQLQIDRHAVSLRYGRLIIYVLNEVILPAMTNGAAHSMSEAFAHWIGCDRLASAMIPSGGICAFGECLHAHHIENVCVSAVSTIFTFADMMVRNLEFDMGLSLGGSGKLVETTSDGIVDFIENGLFEGTLQNSSGGQSGGASYSPFAATWSAERVD